MTSHWTEQPTHDARLSPKHTACCRWTPRPGPAPPCVGLAPTPWGIRSHGHHRDMHRHRREVRHRTRILRSRSRRRRYIYHRNRSSVSILSNRRGWRGISGRPPRSPMELGHAATEAKRKETGETWSREDRASHVPDPPLRHFPTVVSSHSIWRVWEWGRDHPLRQAPSTAGQRSGHRSLETLGSG